MLLNLLRHWEILTLISWRVTFHSHGERVNTSRLSSRGRGPRTSETTLSLILRSKKWRTATSVRELVDILTEIQAALGNGWKAEKTTVTLSGTCNLVPLSQAVLGTFRADKVKALLTRDVRDGSTLTLWEARSAGSLTPHESQIQWYMARPPGELADRMESIVFDLTVGNGGSHEPDRGVCFFLKSSKLVRL